MIHPRPPYFLPGFLPGLFAESFRRSDLNSDMDNKTRRPIVCNRPGALFSVLSLILFSRLVAASFGAAAELSAADSFRTASFETVLVGTTSVMTAPESAANTAPSRGAAQKTAVPSAESSNPQDLTARDERRLNDLQLNGTPPQEPAKAIERRLSYQDLFYFSQIPVLNGGRVKPLSSFARERRKALSALNSFPSSQSAEEWLAEILFEPELASARPLFKIRNPELIDILNLPKRLSAKNIYSFNELSPAMDRALPQIEAAGKKEKRSSIENQLLNLYGGTAEFFQLRRSLLLVLPIFSLPAKEARQAGMEPDRAYNYMEMIRFRRAISRQIKQRARAARGGGGQSLIGAPFAEKSPSKKNSRGSGKSFVGLSSAEKASAEKASAEKASAEKAPFETAPSKKSLEEGGGMRSATRRVIQRFGQKRFIKKSLEEGAHEKDQRLFALFYKLKLLDKEAEAGTENDIFKIIPPLWEEDGELWRSPRELFASGKGGPQSAAYMKAYAEAARNIRACRAGQGGKNAGQKTSLNFADKKSEQCRDFRKIFKTAGTRIYQASLTLARASSSLADRLSADRISADRISADRAAGDSGQEARPVEPRPVADRLSADLRSAPPEGGFSTKSFSAEAKIRPGLLLMEKIFNDIQFFEKSLFFYLAAFLLTLFSFFFAGRAIACESASQTGRKTPAGASPAGAPLKGNFSEEMTPDKAVPTLAEAPLASAALASSKGAPLEGTVPAGALPGGEAGRPSDRADKGSAIRRIVYRLSFFSLSGGLLLHAAGTAFQTAVTGRPPVSNLYESILFVGLVIVAFSAWQERKKRNRKALLLGASAGSVLQFVGMQTKGDEVVHLLVPVLNSNFWLSSHVLCICIGYGCAVTASLQGHAFLFSHIFSSLRKGKKTAAKAAPLAGARAAAAARTEAEASMNCSAGEAGTALASAALADPAEANPARGPKSLVFQQTSAALFAALFFCLFGTVLGGIWADQSWGRFWGWDPKENGALMIILSLLALVHGAEAGILREKGFAAGLILLNIAVALSWFGVNLLNVGLHSYGFSEGAFWGLAVFCAAEAALAVLSLVSIKKPAPL